MLTQRSARNARRQDHSDDPLPGPLPSCCCCCPEGPVPEHNNNRHGDRSRAGTLVALGVRPVALAAKLAREHDPDRIDEVIDYAKRTSRSNPAGLVRRALEEGWVLPQDSKRAMVAQIRERRVERPLRPRVEPPKIRPLNADERRALERLRDRYRDRHDLRDRANAVLHGLAPLTERMRQAMQNEWRSS